MTATIWHRFFRLAIVIYIFGENILFAFNVNNKQPNIVLIVTDDQDLMMGSMLPMKRTQQLLANQGIDFTNAFTSSPICCPSRASILSGMYAHNHGTYNNSQSGGCYGMHWRSKVEPSTLPVWLHQAGYETFFAGKYLNEYHSGLVPPGWNNWFGLVGNSRYYNYTLIENGKPHKYTDEYFTDVLKSHTLDFVSKQMDDRPFFAMITPTAPHAPFTPAERHKEEFQNVKVPRGKNFNVPSGEFDKHWLLRMPPSILPDDTLNHLDDIYRHRWQTLLAIDELVADLIDRLDEMNLLDNTFIIYTSDNGYHLGQFGMAFDKRQPYETDIRVPLIVRGPGIESKSISVEPIVLIDILPTILDIVGITIPNYLDGKSFAKFLDSSYTNEVNNLHDREILIEYWGEGNGQTYNSECPWNSQDNLSMCLLESSCHCQDSWNNTYVCSRYVGKEKDQIYCEFHDHDNFIESYDFLTDPDQMINLGFTMLPSERSLNSIALDKMKTCTGKSCHQLYYSQ